MKKLLFLLLINIPVLGWSYSPKDSASFAGFINYFRETGLTKQDEYFKQDYLNKLPKNLGEKFLKKKLEKFQPSFYSIMLMELDPNYVALVYAIPCEAEGVCEERFLASFDLSQGRLIDEIRYSYEFDDSTHISRASCELQNPNMIKMVKTEIEYFTEKSRKGQIKWKNAKNEYFKIDSNGFFQKIEGNTPPENE